MSESTKLSRKATKDVAPKQVEQEVVIDTDINAEVEQPVLATGTGSFVFMDKTKDILDVSLMTEKNVILHGKGGYGKSEYALAYLKEKGIDPYIITMGSGMTTDRLFGGVDLQKFHETGKIEYLIENSFMNEEFVIFEELFDAPDFILEQLKDILSSGTFRNGTQVFNIKTRNIVCCTNKTREEFAKNLSLRALMERFPLELEVKWNDHNRHTYEKLFTAKFGEGSADPMLTFILEEYAKKGATISPRIALVAADVVASCGPEALEFIADFKLKPEILKEGLAKFKAIAEINDKIVIIDDIVSELRPLIKLIIGSAADASDIQKAKEMNNKFNNEVNALSKIKADDSLAVSVAKKVEGFKAMEKEFSKTINISALVDSIDID